MPQCFAACILIPIHAHFEALLLKFQRGKKYKNVKIQNKKKNEYHKIIEYADVMISIMGHTARIHFFMYKDEIFVIKTQSVGNMMDVFLLKI